MVSKPSSLSPLQQYARDISSAADAITDYCTANKLPQPSLDPNASTVKIPTTAPVEVYEARQKLTNTATTIQQVVTEPAEYLPHLSIQYQTLSALTWIHKFDILSAIPTNGSISYDDLAAARNVPVSELRSITRLAMTTNFLVQTSPTTIAHNATSRLFIEDNRFWDWLGFMREHSIPTALSLPEATARWGAIENKDKDKNMTAWNVAQNTDMAFFDWFAVTKDRANQFAGYMKAVQGAYGTNLKHLVTGYDWASLGNGTVVDVGGSTCASSVALATAYPSLNFIVQDLPDTISQSNSILSSQPPSISSRITPKPHNFFSPQPILDANIYFMRMILHDWPNPESLDILRNLMPAVKANPSARIVIMDTVLPVPGSIGVWDEGLLRVRDLTMMQTFNNRERDLGEFEDLFKGVSDSEGGLVLKGVTKPPGSVMSVMEVAYERK